jgi:hypothetical protein
MPSLSFRAGRLPTTSEVLHCPGVQGGGKGTRGQWTLVKTWGQRLDGGLQAFSRTWANVRSNKV